jgi:hypothetical protein
MLDGGLRGGLIGFAAALLAVAASGSTIKAFGNEILKPENTVSRILTAVVAVAILGFAIVNPGKTEFGVTDADLYVKPPTGFRGNCPAIGSLVGVIKTEGGDGTVTYDLTDANGESRGAQELRFKKRSSRSIPRLMRLQPSFDGEATLAVLEPNRKDASVHVKYFCEPPE